MLHNLSLIYLVLAVTYFAAEGSKRPHVVFVLADDLGYNDIGYNTNESQILTPFLDELAAKGVILENYYVQSTCSPSRSQLMSGRYQIHTGLQHKLRSGRRHGLPLDNKIIPEQLKNCGYDTHMVGKWHLGMFEWEYTPMYRGFNSFFGLLSSGSDHYTHMHYDGRIDMWKNRKPTNKFYGKYSTHLFTEQSIEAIENRDITKPFFLYLAHQAVHSPVQVPRRYSRQFKHIKDKTRREYAGMVLALDESVRNVSKKLEQAGMLSDTIFIFSTDNGGTSKYGGNNWPLKGKKNNLWEGGVKAVGFVSGRQLGVSGVKSKNFMHISDWLPTLLGATTCPKMNSTPPLDGFDQWSAILQKEESPRTELLHALDPMRRMNERKYVHGFDTSIYAAIRLGPWKLLTGNAGKIIWTPPPESGINIVSEPRLKTPRVRLYNIENDPYEERDVSSLRRNIVRTLLRKLAQYEKSSVPVSYPPSDPANRSGGKFFKPWAERK